MSAAWARPGAFTFELSLEGRGQTYGDRRGWHSSYFLPRKVQNGQRHRGEQNKFFSWVVSGAVKGGVFGKGGRHQIL